MTLSIDQVFVQAGTEEMAYVRDGSIHYIVLNREDNTFDLNAIEKYLGYLDEIEATKGPGVLVTIGIGNKTFSSGFELSYLAQDFDDNLICTVERFQELMARLLSLNMPSMCVFNGATKACGYYLGLCHDTRIMSEPTGSICNSELREGIPLPYPYLQVLSSRLPFFVIIKLVAGDTWDQYDSLRMGLIDNTYQDRADLNRQIGEFAQSNLLNDAERLQLQESKTHQHEHLLETLRFFRIEGETYFLYKKCHQKLQKAFYSFNFQKKQRKQHGPRL